MLAVILLGKVLVPAGWMPVAAERGITFMLCSGDGMSAAPVEAWIDASGKIHKGHKDSGNQSKDPCPYGALTATATTPAAVAFAAPLVLPASIVLPRPAEVTVGHGLAAPPPPATGPPAFA